MHDCSGGTDWTEVVFSLSFGQAVIWKRKTTGGLLGFIGFMLSPLSWWNDLFVNVPLAIGIGWIVAFVYPPAFEFAVIVGYWLTNVLGLVLMQKGARRIMSNEKPKYSRADFFRDVGWSLAYTGLILFLLKTGILQPINLARLAPER